MIRRLLTSPLAPWAGLLVGAAAWFAHHQIGSDTNYFNCRDAGGGFTVMVGLVCGAIAIGGGLVSWAAHADDEGETPQNARFARAVGMAGAAIFLLAIGFQTLAGVLVPACHR
jgi:hypothetical protein